MFTKIMNKYNDEDGYGIDNQEEQEKKLDMVKLLPWVAFCANLFIQFLMIIMVCILMGRINLKSHFGFPKEEKSKSSKNKMIDNFDGVYEKKGAKKKGKKKKRANGLEDLESDITIIKNKKTKNKKKKKKKKKTTRKKLN